MGRVVGDGMAMNDRTRSEKHRSTRYEGRRHSQRLELDSMEFIPREWICQVCGAVHEEGLPQETWPPVGCLGCKQLFGVGISVEGEG